MKHFKTIILTGIFLQNLLLIKKTNNMATKSDFAALIGQFNDATNIVANRFEGLIEKIKTGGMTQDEEDETYANFKAGIDTLKSIGADDENPIPEEPEETPVDETEEEPTEEG